MPVYSSVECAGVKLRDVYPQFGTPKDKEGYNEIPQAMTDKFFSLQFNLFIVKI